MKTKLLMLFGSHLLGGVLVLVSCLGALAAEPVLNSEKFLSATQVEEQFSDQTAIANIPGKKLDVVYYFSPDGSLKRAYDGRVQTGEWWARKDGRLCMKFESGKSCRAIAKGTTGYEHVIVKKDGNHLVEFTFEEFRKGPRLAEMSTEPILPLGTLTKKEVVELFSGKTVESVTAKKGRISHTYYHPDGKVEQVRNNQFRYGNWRVRPDGRMCMQMEDLKEKCRIIVLEDGQYKKYIVKKDGRHQHSVSYRSFLSGKNF